MVEVWRGETIKVLERPEVEPTVSNREPTVVRDGRHQTNETGKDGLANDLRPPGIEMH